MVAAVWLTSATVSQIALPREGESNLARDTVCSCVGRSASPPFVAPSRSHRSTAPVGGCVPVSPWERLGGTPLSLSQELLVPRRVTSVSIDGGCRLSHVVGKARVGHRSQRLRVPT